MIKAGITGGIGSGKTTVCRIFENLGVPVFYADIEAKKLLFNEDEVIQQIAGTFGKEMLDSLGKPNRERLAQRVFNNRQELEKLNAIIHPAVARSFHQWLENRTSQPYILKEAAILFESGAYEELQHGGGGDGRTVTRPAGIGAGHGVGEGLHGVLRRRRGRRRRRIEPAPSGSPRRTPGPG